jgi:hypothetical protein
MEGESFFKSEMRRTLENLAADAAAQRRYIESLGLSPLIDELALEFDDICSRLSLALEERIVDNETMAALTRVTDQLGTMSGEKNAELWRVDALDRPEWEAVRALARTALDRWRAIAGG